MKRLAVALVVAAFLVVGVHLLAEATQNREDVVPMGSASRVTFSVSTRRLDVDVAAHGLWAVCQTTIGDHRGGAPARTAQGDYRVEVTPGLGEHDRRRLEGCLEDATIDRTAGTVRAIEPVTGS